MVGTLFVLFTPRLMMTHKVLNLYKGGVMRKMLGIPMVIAMLTVPACVVPTEAGVSVQISIGAHTGYVPFYELEDDIDWNNMVIVDNNRIGLWIMGPSGRWVFRCRDMWYDNACDEWRYGPWGYDYNLTYGSFNGIGFHVFMNQYYPRYHERYFYHDNGFYSRYDHRYFDRRGSYRREHDGRHSDYNAPRMERNEPAIHREKQGVQQVAPARERTTVITRMPTQSARTDGGDRIARANRPSSGPAVRERSATAARVQPSSNGTGVTRSEIRSRAQRR
jgi:hypothetical protein